MKVAVIGVGGVGGVLAGAMSRAGHAVVPVARNPAVRAALEHDGYRVSELDGSAWSAPVTAPPVANLREANGPIDAAIFTTQSPALEGALVDAAQSFSPETIVIVCQNGLPEARARRTLPGARVVGCVVGWGASMTAPGCYKRTSSGGFQLGDPELGSDTKIPSDPALDALVTVLGAQGLTELAENFAGVRWSKLAINSVTSTLGAIGGDALGPLLLNAAVRRLALEIFSEVVAVAAASGVRLAPVGGTFDISSVTLSDAERRASIPRPSLLRKHAVLLAVGAKFRRMRSSMLYALERGRPPEIDFLNGEIARRGAILGVPTPVNLALVTRVRQIEAGLQRPSARGLQALARKLTARGGVAQG